jgi:hypothetical protein
MEIRKKRIIRWDEKERVFKPLDIGEVMYLRYLVLILNYLILALSAPMAWPILAIS